MKITCYSVLKSVIDDAVKMHSLSIDNNKAKDMERICALIDDMADEFDGISYEVIIEQPSFNIIINLDCDEIIIEDKNSSIYDIFNHALSISFKHGEKKESCLASFVFPGIWG